MYVYNNNDVRMYMYYISYLVYHEYGLSETERLNASKTSGNKMQFVIGVFLQGGKKLGVIVVLYIDLVQQGAIYSSVV